MYIKIQEYQSVSIHFILFNRNHANITIEAISELLKLNFETYIFDLELLGVYQGAKKQVFDLLGIETLPVTAIDQYVHCGDVIVVCCDWSPVRSPFHNLLMSLRKRGCLLVGITEGCLWAETSRYRIVDFILAYAPATQSVLNNRVLPRKISIVGSPVIEKSLQKKTETAIKPYVLCNYKIPYDYRSNSKFNINNSWLKNIINACKETNIELKISKHPHAKNVFGIEYSQENLSKLISNAKVLISPVSTVVIEALAHKIPVILYPNSDVPFYEFSNPMGAYEIVREHTELAGALTRALSPNLKTILKPDSFLQEQLLLDPEFPAFKKIAQEIIAIQNEASKFSTSHTRTTFDFLPPWRFKNLTGLMETGDSIICNPDIDKAGHCVFGGDYKIYHSGIYRVTFDLNIEIDYAKNHGRHLFTIDIYERLKKNKVLTERLFYAEQNEMFDKNIVFIEFEGEADDVVESRIYWNGGYWMKFDGLYFEQISLFT